MGSTSVSDVGIVVHAIDVRNDLVPDSETTSVITNVVLPSANGTFFARRNALDLSTEMVDLVLKDLTSPLERLAEAAPALPMFGPFGSDLLREYPNLLTKLVPFDSKCARGIFFQSQTGHKVPDLFGMFVVFVQDGLLKDAESRAKPNGHVISTVGWLVGFHCNIVGLMSSLLAFLDCNLILDGVRAMASIVLRLVFGVRARIGLPLGTSGDRHRKSGFRYCG